jgi:asparagine synthase (glutamine-hydrolysing)
MLRAIRHRGPDDCGRIAIPSEGGRSNVLLGNTRLAILDPSDAGHQPMHDAATGNWIVLNGEIYNHLEVREALSDRVERWNSGTDTETIMRAYATWGLDCLGRLRGMFAFALWDAAANALICARDRLGIKPFYYYEGGGVVVFASEVRALLVSGLVPRRVDRAGVEGFVRFGSVPEPLTLVDGVKSLPAGSWMRIRSGAIERVQEYWCPEPPRADMEEKSPRKVREHLERAVDEHLLSDVPVAAFLSGGIDSSIITALAAKLSKQPLQTFNVGFHETSFDESSYAEAVARQYGTEHQRVLLSDQQVASFVPEAAGAMDLPSADGVNTYVVSKAVAERGIKVVLSGLGGDELFGGYRSFSLLPRAERWSPLIGHLPGRLRSKLAGNGGSGERAAELTDSKALFTGRYESLRSFWSGNELRAMGISSDASYGLRDCRTILPSLTRVSLLELNGYMRSTLLRDSDAMSMANSLELRVPFLDHQLVEYCLRVGAAHSGQKVLLLEAAGDLLPPGIADRPKQGFVLPMERWMRDPLRNYVAEGLAHLEESTLLPKVDLKDLRRRFEARLLPWSRLWVFVVLGHWTVRHLN